LKTFCVHACPCSTHTLAHTTHITSQPSIHHWMTTAARIGECSCRTELFRQSEWRNARNVPVEDFCFLSLFLDFNKCEALFHWKVVCVKQDDNRKRHRFMECLLCSAVRVVGLVATCSLQVSLLLTQKTIEQATQ
jgi:hypothetical protein